MNRTQLTRKMDEATADAYHCEKIGQHRAASEYRQIAKACKLELEARAKRAAKGRARKASMRAAMTSLGMVFGSAGWE